MNLDVKGGPVAMILIATDGSQAAAEAADVGLEIAQKTGDDVVFIAVWDIVRAGYGSRAAYVDQPFIDADRDRAEEVLDGAVRRAWEAFGIHAERLLLQGNPATLICDEAATRNARMIVIGSHGWGAIRGLLSGSVASSVLRRAPCPVLLGAAGSRDALAPDEPDE